MISRIAVTADEAGFDSLWVMDHFFQIRLTGLAPESPMFEAYATLGFLAGQTRRIGLGTIVTSVAYRHPGVLVKSVTSLDVLSGGRVFFGVGAGAPWNVPPAGPGTAFEAEGLGIPFPSLAERFERLEELLQIAHQMWRGDEKPYEGRHYQLVRPLNSPNSVQRPHPPILIGGSGERKTLRLVARYADACNLFDLPGTEFADNIAGKLRVLREHCAAAGRDYAEIEKTVSSNFDLGEDRQAGRGQDHARGQQHRVGPPSRGSPRRSRTTSPRGGEQARPGQLQRYRRAGAAPVSDSALVRAHFCGQRPPLSSAVWPSAARWARASSASGTPRSV